MLFIYLTCFIWLNNKKNIYSNNFTDEDNNENVIDVMNED